MPQSSRLATVASNQNTERACPPAGVGPRRQCPWVSCRHHLALDTTRAGALSHQGTSLVMSSSAPDEARFIDNVVEWLQDPKRWHCSIDVANYYRGMTLRDVAERLNITRERVRQIESNGIRRLQSQANAQYLRGLRDHLGVSSASAMDLSRRAREVDGERPVRMNAGAR